MPAQVAAAPLNPPMAAKATTDSLRSPGLLVTRRGRSSELRQSTRAVATATRPAHVARTSAPLEGMDGVGQSSLYCSDRAKSQASSAEGARSASKTWVTRRANSSRDSRRAAMRSATKVSRQYQPEERPVWYSSKRSPNSDSLRRVVANLFKSQAAIAGGLRILMQAVLSGRASRH